MFQSPFLQRRFHYVERKSDLPLSFCNEIWMQGNGDQLRSQQADILIYTAHITRHTVIPSNGPPPLVSVSTHKEKSAWTCRANNREPTQPYATRWQNSQQQFHLTFCQWSARCPRKAPAALRVLLTSLSRSFVCHLWWHQHLFKQGGWTSCRATSPRGYCTSQWGLQSWCNRL